MFQGWGADNISKLLLRERPIIVAVARIHLPWWDVEEPSPLLDYHWILETGNTSYQLPVLKSLRSLELTRYFQHISCFLPCITLCISAPLINFAMCSCCTNQWGIWKQKDWVTCPRAKKRIEFATRLLFCFVGFFCCCFVFLLLIPSFSQTCAFVGSWVCTSTSHMNGQQRVRTERGLCAWRL